MEPKKNLLDSVKQLVIILALAVLIPMTIDYGSTLLDPYPSYPARVAGMAPSAVSLDLYHQLVEKYESTLFYTCLICGAACIAAGIFFKWPVIDSGLILGGLISLINGYTTYWEHLPKLLQFLSLLGALLLIIVSSYNKFVKKENNSP